MPDISLVPMLQIQRNLYEIPRGPDRFRRYIEVMTGGSNDIVLPLPVFNPMGKDHVRGQLDTLLALDAEALAVRAIEGARRRLVDVEGILQLSLVVADDVGGKWTNRHHAEIENHFPYLALQKLRDLEQEVLVDHESSASGSSCRSPAPHAARLEINPYPSTRPR